MVFSEMHRILRRSVVVILGGFAPNFRGIFCQSCFSASNFGSKGF